MLKLELVVADSREIQKQSTQVEHQGSSPTYEHQTLSFQTLNCEPLCRHRLLVGHALAQLLSKALTVSSRAAPLDPKCIGTMRGLQGQEAHHTTGHTARAASSRPSYENVLVAVTTPVTVPVTQVPSPIHTKQA